MSDFFSKHRRSVKQFIGSGTTADFHFQSVLKAFFPAKCLVCERPISAGRICARCGPPLPHVEAFSRCPMCFQPAQLAGRHTCCELCILYPLPTRHQRHLFLYEGNLRRAVTRMKYGPSRALASFLASLLASKIYHLFRWPDWHVVIPVPSSGASLSKRSFNQCSILADRLVTLLSSSGHLNPLLSPLAMSHLGCPSPQASLPESKRFSNVKRAFLADTRYVKGKRVLLVDDVITTGATTASATLSLLEAGAKCVDVLTLAISPSWSTHRSSLFKAFSRF